MIPFTYYALYYLDSLHPVNSYTIVKLEFYDSMFSIYTMPYLKNLSRPRCLKLIMNR